MPAGSGKPANDPCPGTIRVVLAPLRMSVPPDPATLHDVRLAVQRWLTEAGADDVDDVVLAVNEAVANAIEHARVPRRDPTGPEPAAGAAHVDGIVLTAEVIDTRFRLRVVDQGTWRPNEADDRRGRGLSIVRAVMDTVDLAHGEGPTTVVMERRLVV